MTAFIGGFAQFFIPMHLLAVTALGLMAGQARYPKATLSVLALGMLVGSWTVASGIQESPAALVLLALTAITGGLLILGRTVVAPVASFLASLTGVFIPANAPPHEITIAGAVSFQIGLAVAALMASALVMLAAASATRPWQRIGIRIVGSWITASAILVLALRLVR